MINHQDRMTPDDKRAFIENARAEGARFIRSLRKITDGAENRMRDRTALQQQHDALRELNRGPDEVVPDAHPEIQRDMLR